MGKICLILWKTGDIMYEHGTFLGIKCQMDRVLRGYRETIKGLR